MRLLFFSRVVKKKENEFSRAQNDVLRTEWRKRYLQAFSYSFAMINNLVLVKMVNQSETERPVDEKTISF